MVAGAAFGVFATAALGGGAEAKTVRHQHARARGSSESERALAAEVQTLKGEVQTLEGRLDAQARDQQQTQAQVQATQAQAQTAQNQAQAAQAQAQAAQTQIETIPTEVKTAVAAAAPKPGWWANTTVGGTMFGDISHISNSSDSVAQPNQGTDYDIKRFYIAIDHKFNNVFSANVTTDFTYDSGPAAATQLYLKKAYLQAKLSDALVVRLGSADLPWVPYVENLYGYRYVENVLIDRTKFGTSADWGVHVSGMLAGGMFDYAFSAIDGSGYKKPAIGTANRTNAIDVEGRVGAHLGGFTAAVGGYAGKLGKDIQGTATYNTAERFDALVAYTDKRFRVGGEYFWASDWNDVTQANPHLTNRSAGYSVFGSFNFTDQIAVFGRYDWVKPKESTTPSETDNYFNVGVSYRPIKIVDFALVYKRDKLDNGLFNTSNGLIGGVHTGTYDEIGLFTQVKW
jgi:hypothetical protein